MQDRRLRNGPKILKTPKGEDLKEDRMNFSVEEVGAEEVSDVGWEN